MTSADPARSVRAAGYRFYFADEVAQQELQPCLDAIAHSRESLPAFEVKRKGKIRKSFTFSFRLGNRTVYCKSVRPKNVAAYGKGLLRASRARNFWMQTRRLEEMGFPGPRLIAFAEKRTGPFVRESLLLCDEVENAVPLSSYVQNILARRNSRRELWGFARQLGSFIGRMHRAGVAHGDLRLNNILVQSVGGEPRFVLLDHDRTDVKQPIPNRLRLKNIQQINLIFERGLNLTDRLRFFDSYHQALGRPPLNREAHLRELIAACERRLHRYIDESKDLKGLNPSGGYAVMMRAITTARRAAQ